MVVMELRSELTCPACGGVWAEIMPLDACLVRYRCDGCQAELRPKQGDCCVFCSYGSVPCPPIQVEAAKNRGTGDCCDTKGQL
jgi:hypothetical protein